MIAQDWWTQNRLGVAPYPPGEMFDWVAVGKIEFGLKGKWKHQLTIQLETVA